jgi:electron transport complex protein RnfG
MRDIFRLCFVLTVISAISAGVLAFVNERTEEPIARALLEEKLGAVRSVLPPFDNDPGQDAVTVEAEGKTIEIYRGRSGGAVSGAAFVVTAPDGYSGDIVFMIGVDTAGVVTGIEILQHLETPGLGAKIQEEGFRRQYEGKSLDDPATWAVTKDGGTFVPITGATISSRAVTAATEKGLRVFREHRGEILGVEAPAPADSAAAEDKE